MLLRTVRPAVLFVALALAGSAFGQDAAPSRETGSVSAPDPKAFEQIVKLWKAKLSEEFLLRKIERETVIYRLSTEDIISCKAAGVPESIIEAMMKTEGRGHRPGEPPRRRAGDPLRPRPRPAAALRPLRRSRRRFRRSPPSPLLPCTSGGRRPGPPSPRPRAWPPGLTARGTES